MRTTIDQLYPDIWHYVFEYFDTTELFLSFVNITAAANEVLFNDNSNFYFRGLRLDSLVETLPEKLPFGRIHSLEIHEGTTFDVLRKCSALRSLKLNGGSEWITSLLTSVSSKNIQLKRLILVMSDTGILKTILKLAGLISALRELVILADEIEENIQMNNISLSETRIESFTLHSSSAVHWNDLLNLLPALLNVHFLDVTLVRESRNYFLPLKFHKLRHVRLILLETSFYSLIQLVTTTPFLLRLKLTGLVDAEGYVVNHKWNNLFNFCPSIETVQINLSLEEGVNNFRKDTILTGLNEVNLKLRCLSQEYSDYANEPNPQRWWSLSGILNRDDLLTK